MISIATYAPNHQVVKQLKKYRIAKYLEEAGHELNHEQQTFIKRIESAVNSLPRQERELIEKRYLVPDSDYITDQQIYQEEMQISYPYFRVIRERTFKKLAIILGLNKLNEKDDE